MGEAGGAWEMLVGNALGEHNSCAAESVSRSWGCCTRADFWAGLGWMFAALGWVRWRLHAASLRWLTAAAGVEHCPECLFVICMGFFGVWGLFVWVVIEADWWLYLEPDLDRNGHGARAGFGGA